ncbi:MAG: hypothetical protein KDI36_09780 [Pseudomonadales bacterium]|nr:hypothetical protein [Pseudomonadales bacterium]
MIAITEFTIFSVIEAFSVLLLGIIALVFYNGRLRTRIRSLNHWLNQLKNTTAGLIEEANKAGRAFYADYLKREIQSTEDHLKQLKTQNSDDESESATTERASTLRHMFLTSEFEADQASNDDEKWARINHGMTEVVQAIEETGQQPNAAAGNLKLQSSWGNLCDSAKAYIETNNQQDEAALIDAIHEVNEDMGLEPLKLKPGSAEDRLIDLRPAVASRQGKVISKATDRSEEVQKHKDAASQQKKLIAALLKQKTDAEAEISVKTSELQQLQRYQQESELCVQLLEDELKTAHDEINALMKAANTTPEMESILHQHSLETSELLTCIETLEKENEKLRKSLGQK